MNQTRGRTGTAGTASDPSGLDDVRTSIARNCASYADDAAASSAAADLIITMRRTTTALQSTMESYARKYQLSPSKIIIIMALAAAENATLAQGEIARQLAVSLGSLTALVTSLETAGIVKRTIARDDRRVSRISLTAKGAALVRRFAPEHYRSEAAAVSVLTAREQRTLIVLLDKLRAHQIAPLTEPSPGIGTTRRPRLIALIVSFAFFMQQLDGTVIATALPQMAHTFGETPINVSVGVTAYLLTLAVFIPSSSWAADRWGSRTIFGGAIVVFTIGSILCGISNSLIAFVASRILQAIGGAMMLPVGRLAVLRTAEKYELIRVMQYITIPGLVAPVLGPPLGGFITTFASWRWIFFLNIPIGVAGVILVFIFMQNDRPDERRPFDTAGFFLSGVGLASVMYGFTLLGHEDGYWLTTALFLFGGAGIVALALRHARSHPTPLLDLAPMNVKTFAIATMSGGAIYRMIIGATLFLWPIMFQVGFGLSAFVSGLLVMATAAGDFLGQLFVRPLIRRFGFRPMMVTACVVTTLLIFCSAIFTRYTPFALISAVLLVIGLCRSLQFTAMNTLAYSDIPQPRMGAASTLASTLQQLAVGLGVAFGAFAVNSIAFVHGDAGHTLSAPDFQYALVAVGMLGVISALIFARLPRDAGVQMTRDTSAVRPPAKPETG